jgi:hypothetical protein
MLNSGCIKLWNKSRGMNTSSNRSINLMQLFFSAQKTTNIHLVWMNLNIISPILKDWKALFTLPVFSYSKTKCAYRIQMFFFLAATFQTNLAMWLYFGVKWFLRVIIKICFWLLHDSMCVIELVLMSSILFYKNEWRKTLEWVGVQTFDWYCLCVCQLLCWQFDKNMFKLTSVLIVHKQNS